MKKNIQNDFPIFSQIINGKPIIYLDSAATSQKPQQVLDSLLNFYTTANANVHRGIHFLAEHATQMYEDARAKVAQFINAKYTDEIIFTKNTTEGINLVAATWADVHIKEGHEILLTELEHHSNLVPWQLLAEKKRATLKFIPVHHDGTIDLSSIDKLINKKTKLVSVCHVSNALGVHVPIKDIIDASHAVGARVLIDAAQSVPHQPIDIQKMNADFLAFSGHKILAPTGIGVLYIKQDLHEHFPPYQTGGGTVEEASYTKAVLRLMPYELEAGTPPIAQAIALGTAIDYLTSNVDWASMRELEASLTSQLIDGLSKISRIKINGPIHELKKVGHLVNFVIDGIHAHDVAAYLSEHNICVRAGHHCAQPLAKKLGIDASVRASFYFYNTHEEVEQLIKVINKLVTEL